MKKIGIVSCNKWKNKLFEDNIIKEQFIKSGYEADIISWEEKIDYSKYDALILRSVWGYQNKYFEFKNWLLFLKKRNVKLFNCPELMLNNIDKYKQFNILMKNNINTISTVFKDNINDIDNYIGYVIKPSISGSGDNTFIINENNINDIKDSYIKLLNNKELKIMIQPFISEVNDGEYSVIFIDGKISHVMKRWPGILTESKRTECVHKIPNNIIDMAIKIEKLKEFEKYLYMRVDMVISKNEVLVMEVELAEPDLLTKYVDIEEKQKDIAKRIVYAIEKRI